MRRTASLSLALMLAAASAAASAQSFSTLEERMSAAEFRAAGLDKLSDEELAALNAWLQRKGVTAESAAAGTDRIGFDDGGMFRSSASGDRFEATISGTFTGWRKAGDLITLSNGQVWRVTDSSTSLSVNLTNPRVVLQRNAFGGWQLSVEGYNTRARVIRER